MQLCIFGRDDDPISARIDQIAKARGHDVLRVSFARLAEGAPCAFDDEGWLFEGHDLAEKDAYVVRQYPAATAMLGAPSTTDTAQGWWKKGMLQKERSSFAQSCIMDVELSGKPVVNPLFASQHFDHKPLQLAVFRRAGLPIPRTLITNLGEAVDAFAQDVAEVIFKPTTGGAEAGVLDDAARMKLALIKQSPVIFQERARGDDVRVTVVGDEVVSAVVIPSDGLDYRSGQTYQQGDIAYAPIQLPADVRAMSVTAARACHHVLSGIDWKRGPDDKWTLLEANSGPVYLDIENKTGAPISEAIVKWLERALTATR